jgi:hypothetical protein
MQLDSNYLGNILTILSLLSATSTFIMSFLDKEADEILHINLEVLATKQERARKDCHTTIFFLLKYLGCVLVFNIILFSTILPHLTAIWDSHNYDLINSLFLIMGGYFLILIFLALIRFIFVGHFLLVKIIPKCKYNQKTA